MPICNRNLKKKINAWESAAINHIASYGINVSLWHLERETVLYFFDSCICGKQTLNKAILSNQKKKKIFHYNSLPVWFYFAWLLVLAVFNDWCYRCWHNRDCCQRLWSMKVDNEQLKSAVTESCPDTFPHWETATWGVQQCWTMPPLTKTPTDTCHSCLSVCLSW